MTHAFPTRRSSDLANIAGEANEIYGDWNHDQPGWEKNMDRWNNATGREIGQSSSSSQETAQRVFDALRRGDLIADPHNDSRDYYNDGYGGDGSNGGGYGGGSAAGSDGGGRSEERRGGKEGVGRGRVRGGAG